MPRHPTARQSAASRRNLALARAMKNARNNSLITLYHRTSRKSANAIVSGQKFKSNQFDKSVYFSTKRNGGARSYGPSVVSIQVRKGLVRNSPLDNMWQAGTKSQGKEQLVKVAKKNLKGVRISRSIR